RDFHVTGVQTCALPICERVADVAQVGRVLEAIWTLDRRGVAEHAVLLDPLGEREVARRRKHGRSHLLEREPEQALRFRMRGDLKIGRASGRKEYAHPRS